MWEELHAAQKETFSARNRSREHSEDFRDWEALARYREGSSDPNDKIIYDEYSKPHDDVKAADLRYKNLCAQIDHDQEEISRLTKRLCPKIWGKVPTRSVRKVMVPEGRAQADASKRNELIQNLRELFGLLKDCRPEDNSTRKKRGGRPPLSETKPLKDAIYRRIHAEHKNNSYYCDTIERLKSDTEFMNQLQEAKLSLNTELVTRALSCIDGRNRKKARNQQQTD